MNRCSTCRFWGSADGGDDINALERVREDSERLGLWDRVRPCGAIHQNVEANGAYAHTLEPKEKALVCDGSGYYASLRTASDFGCVLHRALP